MTGRELAQQLLESPDPDMDVFVITNGVVLREPEVETQQMGHDMFGTPYVGALSDEQREVITL